jgi:ribosomal protein S18 acetylase RimI-like enzyme
MTIRIRPYREEDRERLKEITVAAFTVNASIDRRIEEQFGMLNGVDWATRKRQSIDADCDAHPAGILVAEADDGRVVAYITTRLNPDSRLGWIPNLAVDPTCQGTGVGRQLIQAALDYLRAAGMKHAKIETLSSNERGQALYPTFGFVEVARQIHYVASLEGKGQK